MHADGVVERNVHVQERVSKERDEIATHRHQQRRIGEHHRTGRAPGDCHSVAADTPKSRLFPLDRENWTHEIKGSVTLESFLSKVAFETDFRKKSCRCVMKTFAIFLLSK